MWSEVLERFEQHAPVGVMARVALEQALPAGWIDEVFEANRQRQYPRELMMSTVVELMLLVSLGLRPSLHAAARKMEHLPVSLAALYDKVNCTEPAVLRALVQGSAARLAPVMVQLDGETSLSGWRLRILDGNHLPASEKRLSPLRDQREAALPGHTLVDLRSGSGLGHGHRGVRGCARERAYHGPDTGGLGTGGRAVAGRPPFLHPRPVAGLAAGGSSLHCARAGPGTRCFAYHLALDVVSDYKGMLIALPPSAWCSWSEASPERMADYLLRLARFVSPRSVATSKRGPKKPKPKGYVDAATVRKHVSTARVLRSVKAATP